MLTDDSDAPFITIAIKQAVFRYSCYNAYRHTKGKDGAICYAAFLSSFNVNMKYLTALLLFALMALSACTTTGTPGQHIDGVVGTVGGAFGNVSGQRPAP